MTNENKLKKIAELIKFWENVLYFKKKWIKENRCNPSLKIEIPEEKAKINILKSVIKSLKRVMKKNIC